MAERPGGIQPAAGPARACAAALALLAAALAAPACAPRAAADETVSLGGAALRDSTGPERYARTFRYRLGRPTSITPTPDGRAVLFLRSGPRSFVHDLWTYDVAKRSERVLVTAEGLLRGAAEHLTPEELARRERQRSAARGIATFALSRDGRRVLVPLSGRLYLLERASGDVRELASDGPPAEDPRLSPDGARVACVRDGDLYVTDVATGAERRMTTRERPGITYGLAEFVAQEEMDRDAGYWWSPDSRRIAYQRTDADSVERMHIVDPANPTRPPQEWPYPRPGHANVAVTLHVAPVAGGASIEVRWDHQRWPYLCAVTWPDRGPLTLTVMSRDQRDETLFAADDSTGATRALLTEHDDAWLNLDPGLPRWLDDGSGFLWTSERTGAWTLERRAADGRPVRVLSAPALGYRGLVTVDARRGVAWVRAGEEPTETHLYRVRLDGRGEPERVTRGRGVHGAVFGRGAETWVHTVDPLEGERRIAVCDARGRELGALRSVAEEPRPRPRVALETVGERTLRAAIVRPTAFDSTRRYPVVVDVYGGPHAQTAQASWSRYATDQWLADEGFVVVSIDGRGTPARGRAWERAIAADLAGPMLEDQVAGLRALGARHPEMDLSRVGIWGWSFGGFATCMAVMRRPDVFACGVAVAPVADWEDYDTFYTERYLGLLSVDSLAYRRSSLLTYAPALERPLLVIHGTADDNVYFVNSLRLSDALTRAGRRAEIWPMIGQAHGINDPTLNARVFTRLALFLKDRLGPPR